MAKTTELKLESAKFQNFLINGNFDFWQRGTSFAAVANQAYTTDRFTYAKNGSAVHSISRSTDVPGVQSLYSMLTTTTTTQSSLAAGDFFEIEQRIEGNILRPLVGRKAILSFWVKAAVAGIYCIKLTNVGADRSFVYEYTVASSNVWQFIKMPIDTIPTAGTWNYTTGLGLYVVWALGSGTTYQTATTNQWIVGNYNCTANQVNMSATNGSTFQISQCMLTEGVEAPSMFYMHGSGITQELSACQRYYEKSYDLTDAPGTSIGGSGSMGGAFQYVAVAATGGAGQKNGPSFTTKKRATPNITLYSPYDGQANRAFNINTVADINLTPELYGSGSFCTYEPSAQTNGNVIRYMWTADAEF